MFDNLVSRNVVIVASPIDIIIVCESTNSFDDEGEEGEDVNLDNPLDNWNLV